MTTYAEDLHAWLRSKRAECAERAESPGTTSPATGGSHSAHCAHSARSDHGAASGLPEGFDDWDSDAQDLFHERMGIAAEPGMDLRQGSSAWTIAMAEAQTMRSASSPEPTVPIGDFGTPDHIATTVAALLGVPVYIHIRPPNTNFPGEPDWGVVIPPSSGTSRSSGSSPSPAPHVGP